MDSHQRLKTYPVPAHLGWSFDRPAILDALDELAIDSVVVMRYSNGFKVYKKHGHRLTTHGTHRIVNDEHWITLNEMIAGENLNNVLWHELTHAAQAERMLREGAIETLKDFDKLYRKLAGGMGAEYDNNLFEAEARQVARQNTNKMLLRIER